MDIRKNAFSIGLCLAILCAPGIALANTGGPLLLFYTIYQVLFVLLLPVCESLALKFVFKCPFSKSIIWLFMGNLISTVIGIFVVDAESVFRQATIHSLLSFSVLLWSGAFVVSVLSEYVFFLYAFRDAFGAFQFLRSMKACLLVHAGFYVLLAPFYLHFSYFGALEGSRPTKDLSFMKDMNAWVYFFSTGKDAVMRCRPDGAQLERCFDFSSDPDNLSLWLKKSSRQDSWDLCITGEYYVYYNGECYGPTANDTGSSERLLVENFCPSKAWTPPYEQVHAMISMYGPSLCSDLRPSPESKLYYKITSRWYLRADKREDKEEHWEQRNRKRVLTSPAWGWPIHNLSVLPGDRLIFQFGDQICALDYPTRKIGIVARGYRPLVILDVK